MESPSPLKEHLRKLKLATLQIENPRVRRFKQVKPKAVALAGKEDWNDRFTVTESMRNQEVHAFYRHYFGKPSKSLTHTYRIKYATHANELPGILPADEPAQMENQSLLASLP
jgi:hypothetical protein